MSHEYAHPERVERIVSMVERQIAKERAEKEKIVPTAERFFIDYETFKTETDEKFHDLAEDVEENFLALKELKERVDRLSVYGPEPRESNPFVAPMVTISYADGSTTIPLKGFKGNASRLDWDLQALVAAIEVLNKGS